MGAGGVPGPARSGMVVCEVAREKVDIERRWEPRPAPVPDSLERGRSRLSLHELALLWRKLSNGGTGGTSFWADRISTSLLRLRDFIGETAVGVAGSDAPAGAEAEWRERLLMLMLARVCGRRASGTSSSSSESSAVPSLLLSSHAIGAFPLCRPRRGLGGVARRVAKAGESDGCATELVGVDEAFDPVGVGGKNAREGAERVWCAFSGVLVGGVEPTAGGEGGSIGDADEVEVERRSAP